MPQPAMVKAHRLRDFKLEGWHEKIAGRWSYRQLAADPQWREGWISFDAVTWNENDGLLYCGLNTIDGDLVYAFDPASEKFESLGAKAWVDEFDVKIHRTLLINPHDHQLYFATSLLHDQDRQQQAPGGKVVRFDPTTRRYEILAVPEPHLYIQSIAADWQRGLIYGFTYPAEFLFSLDLRSGKVERVAYVGNAISFAQPHNAVVDGEGWLWGTCAETRAWDELTGPVPIRLFKYHPEGTRFVWFEHGLSRKADTEQLMADPPAPTGAVSAMGETRHKQDYGFCDSMLYDGNRYIFAGTTAGVLSRIDTTNGEVVKVASIMATGRFPALAMRDGLLYGGGGMKGHTQLVRCDLERGSIDSYTDLSESTTGERPARIHEIAVDAGHRLYLGENDNHTRSSYLWTVQC